MGWLDRERRRLSKKAVERQNRGYPAAMRGRVRAVMDDEWVSQFDAADRLGVSMYRVGQLIANGTLQAAENPAGQAGVTSLSVAAEREWRRTASAASKLRRLLRDLVRWI